jgi:Putative adhesin
VKRTLQHLFAAALLVCLPAFAGTIWAQEFQRTYPLAADGTLAIESVAGGVSVVGYDGDVISVSGFKEGRDPEKVEVVDRSSAGSVRLGVEYAPRYRGDARVRFEVRVPRSVRLRVGGISTASGDVRISGVTGDVRVSTASGRVEVRDVRGDVRVEAASGDVVLSDIAGSATAETASGDVEADIAHFEGAPVMSFSAASGNVRVRLAPHLGASVSLSASGGEVSTDFPFEVRTDPHSGHRSARGEVAGGGARLRLSTATGAVSLKRL